MNHLFEALDYAGINILLENNPELANEGIAYDANNTTKAHPLHRICDGVFAGKYSDAEAVKLAKLFLDHGADVNGGELVPQKDSPLVAAASLHADQVAMLYIVAGAEINHPGCHGGTALHWAAWCGRPELVKKLIEAGAEINKLCGEFQSTPLFWAVHGLRSGECNHLDEYKACVKMLLEAGVDKSVPNVEGHLPVELVREDEELRGWLEVCL